MIQIRVKTKLSLGLAFLFAVIILIGGMSAFYIHRIARDSKEILKDNYESIEYAQTMLQSSDNLDKAFYLSKFETALKQQETNITENGEKELTENIRTEFEFFKKTRNTGSLKTLRHCVYQVMEVNMQAIVRKNNLAQETADKALSYIGIIGGICFLIVFVFLVNFPGYIADPIRELTESIKQIAAKNYTQRLYFQSNDEFGELAQAFNSMAQELDKFENSNLAKIMFEKKRIEIIINNMLDAIIGLNEKKIILFTNLQALQILGLAERDCVGKYAPDVAVNNDLMRKLINNNNNQQPIKIFADNKESYFTREAIAVNSEEKPIGEVIILKNITRFQELDLAKTNLIATISHELKTPIASIKLSSKLLQDERVGKLNEEQYKLIANIDGDSERLLKITAEVLNMAQVESGNIQIIKKQTRPEKIIEYAINATQTQALQKKIEIKVFYEGLLPEINVDADKTAWVMINFLSNAIRYSPPNGNIFVNVKNENSKISFTVTDQGVGIDLLFKDKVFDKYFQAPNGKKDGTGLGLAISKDFIEAQEGIIWVDSTLNKGSTFGFSFNLV